MFSYKQLILHILAIHLKIAHLTCITQINKILTKNHMVICNVSEKLREKVKMQRTLLYRINKKHVRGSMIEL